MDKTPKVAEEDIIIYKVLIEKDGKLVTPFYYMEYELNKLYINPEKIKFTDWKNVYFFIGEGFYHSFSMLELAKRSCVVFDLYKVKYRIFKGIIPKGTEYYQDCGLSKNYASKAIMLIENII